MKRFPVGQDIALADRGWTITGWLLMAPSASRRS
jgi:hypothetical protein